jgi:integrase/recombinase XerD
MSALTGHVSDYLAMRRALGYKLERAGQLLPQLVSYLEARGAPAVTAELAIAWARLPGHATPATGRSAWPSPAASPAT